MAGDSRERRCMGEVLAREESRADSRRRVLSFSSEIPVKRWFGPEILDHGGKAANFQRLQEIGVLLFNHDPDQVIGRVHKAWIENGRGLAEVEFDTDEASERIFQKVCSGTLKTTSVSYDIQRWERVKEGRKSRDGRFVGPCWVARRWTPLEISIVSVPADPTVGVGRSAVDSDCDLDLYRRRVQINQNIGRR